MKKVCLFGISLLSVAILAACSSGTDTESSKSASSSSTTEQTSKTSTKASKDKKTDSNQKKTYKVGDTITFKDKAEITITGAEWTDERNQFEDSNPEKVLKVTYNVKNISDEDYSVGSDLELYVNGKKMESYANDNTLETISAGRSYEGATQHFGVTGSGNIEVEVKPSFSFDSDKAIVKLDIK